jgi:hypothetical protein
MNANDWGSTARVRSRGGSSSESARVSQPSRRIHQIFGVIAASDLPLPLPVVNAEPVVEIVLGAVSVTGELVWRDEAPFSFSCFRDDSALFLEWSGVRFRVTENQFVIDANDHSSAADLLVPAVWSVFLAMRGQETLHACAVERGGQALAILGASGSGKSTAGMALLDRDWRLVTDDLLALDANGNAIPGPPFVRIDGIGATAELGQRDSGGKHLIAVSSCSAAVPVSSLIILADGFRSCKRLLGAAAVQAILGQVYSSLAIGREQNQRRLELAADLADRARIYGAPPRSLTADLLECIASQTDP